MSFCGSRFWLDFPKSYTRLRWDEVEDACSTMSCTYRRNSKGQTWYKLKTSHAQITSCSCYSQELFVPSAKCHVSLKYVHAVFTLLFQELFLLCTGQPEPAAALGLVQTQADHPAGAHVFPLQLQTLHVWDPQNGGGDGNQRSAGQERHRLQDQRRPGFM